MRTKTGMRKKTGDQPRMLVLANAASMIVQFNMRNLALLKELGYQIEVACNFKKGNTCTDEVIKQLKKELAGMQILFHQIDFARGMSGIREQVSALRQAGRLMGQRKYDIVFAQSAIAGIAARIYGKKHHCKIIYIAHGFQFYEGAPGLRRAVFFTLEKVLSWQTDTLILTNRDDYKLAEKYFHAKECLFIPGVGVDIKAQAPDSFFDRNAERKKWGLEPDDYVFFSAGELTARKNHRIVMEIIREMKNSKVKYVICGIGPLEDEYRKLIKKWGMHERIYLLGYQTDLKSIYMISDVFILPSLNEGLPVCLMMALASRTVSVCSDIRGNHELVRDRRYLFQPKDRDGIRKCMEYVMQHDKENRKTVQANYENLEKYSSQNVDRMMKAVFNRYYRNCLAEK